MSTMDLGNKFVWYDKKLDEIFINIFFDINYFGLSNINWKRYELIGEL